jgi:hypothetical protein
MARRDGMRRPELIFLHSASADGCNLRAIVSHEHGVVAPYVWAHPISAAMRKLRATAISVCLPGSSRACTPLTQTSSKNSKEWRPDQPCSARPFRTCASGSGITASDVELACEALGAGTICPRQMIYWSMGGQLAKLPSLKDSVRVADSGDAKVKCFCEVCGSPICNKPVAKPDMLGL